MIKDNRGEKLNLRQLEFFVVLAQTEHMTQAAKNLIHHSQTLVMQ